MQHRDPDPTKRRNALIAELLKGSISPAAADASYSSPSGYAPTYGEQVFDKAATTLTAPAFWAAEELVEPPLRAVKHAFSDTYNAANKALGGEDFEYQTTVPDVLAATDLIPGGQAGKAMLPLAFGTDAVRRALAKRLTSHIDPQLIARLQREIEGGKMNVMENLAGGATGLAAESNGAKFAYGNLDLNVSVGPKMATLRSSNLPVYDIDFPDAAHRYDIQVGAQNLGEAVDKIKHAYHRYGAPPTSMSLHGTGGGLGVFDMARTSHPMNLFNRPGGSTPFTGIESKHLMEEMGVDPFYRNIAQNGTKHNPESGFARRLTPKKVRPDDFIMMPMGNIDLGAGNMSLLPNARVVASLAAMANHRLRNPAVRNKANAFLESNIESLPSNMRDDFARHGIFR